jgi:hypothetical protein
LSEYSHQLIVDETSTFEGRFFDTFDLLLNDDFESGSSDEESGRRTLREARLELAR